VESFLLLDEVGLLVLMVVVFEVGLSCSRPRNGTIVKVGKILVLWSVSSLKTLRLERAGACEIEV
jgi:hypothetical protein